MIYFNLRSSVRRLHIRRANMQAMVNKRVTSVATYEITVAFTLSLQDSFQ